MELKGKTAIVTGVTHGLGHAIVTALTDKGVTVYGIARNRSRLTDIKNQIGDLFIPVELDISLEEKVTSWMETTFSASNIPYILINNAGIGGFYPIDEMTSEQWLKMVNVNINGTYFLTSRVAHWMKKTTDFSHIITIGSILGTMSRENGAAYCATKYAINGFSDALFKELRFFNIKVTVINPGSLDTDFFKSSGIEKHSNMLHPDDVANTIIHVLETPDNMLINELTVRPLNPKNTDKLKAK